MFLPGGTASRLLQNAHYFIGIKSPTKGAKLANTDISVVTRISHNGKHKCFLAIRTGGDICTENPRANSDNSSSKNCTRYRCQCSFIEKVSQKECAASKEKLELLVNPVIGFDVELHRSVTEFSFPELHIFPALKPEVLSTEEVQLIYFLSYVLPRTHNAGDFAIWKSQIPL
jgi:hypothetical protein